MRSTISNLLPMDGIRRWCLPIAMAACFVAPIQRVYAEGEGQEDLDKATLVKLQAKTMGDLETAIELTETALEKGLDDENEVYAKDLLTATLYEHASRLSALIFDRQPIDPRWRAARRVSMKNLDRALEINAEMGNAQLLVARLQALPGGDRDRAKAAVEKAIKLLAEEEEQLATALVVRGGLAENPEEMLADFERAIKLNPRDVTAWRARGLYYLTQGQHEKALDDFRKLLETDPDDLRAHQAVAQTLQQMKQYDKALEHLDQVIKAEPKSSIPYMLRAQILEENDKTEEAIESLNDAIRVSPADVAALLMRARLRATEGQFDLAHADVDRSLRLQPRMPQAILLRSVILAAQRRFDDAIGDLQQLLRQNPDNADIKIQIATYHEANREPTRAIEIYDDVIEENPESWVALRRRGDAYLSKGMHKEAIQDYEEALKHQPEDSGILNNLAWVLATSPVDDLRDGSRSVDLARKACEVTEYKQAHILSTLAAGHAEAGDFEKAVEWSSKAVEMEDPNQTEQVDDQLERELKSYQEKKPWREQQNVEEEDQERSLDDADLDSLEDLRKDAGDDADSEDVDDAADEDAESAADDSTEEENAEDE